MISRVGSVKRPPTNDNHGPKPGTVVSYRLAQPIVDLAEQAEAFDIPILGIRGNVDHLEKHGDHTPWALGKKPGIIYAIDLSMPVDFEQWLVAKCKSNYDTQWIDFWNLNGRQYSNAGVLVARSDDHHLHVSVELGYENTHVTLINDYLGDDMTPEEFWDHKITSKALNRTAAAADWIKSGAAADASTKALASTMLAATAAAETRDRATLAAIKVLTDALKGTGASNLDTAAIIAAIHAEAENSRKDTATRITAMFTKLSASFKDST